MKMLSYKQFGNQFMKTIQNEKKASELARFLTKKAHQKVNYEQSEYTQINESDLKYLRVIPLRQEQRNDVISTNSKANHIKQNESLSSYSINDDSVKNQELQIRQKQFHQIRSQNKSTQKIQKLSQITDCQQPQSQPENQYLIANHLEKRIRDQGDFRLCNLQKLQQKQQYFELQIINQNLKKKKEEDELHDRFHQVKLFHDDCSQSQKEQKQTFNLSNFSSFNTKNLPSDHPISTAESQFYQKEFIYLVKKIQLINRRKLSSQGLQKILSAIQNLTHKINPIPKFSQPEKLIQKSEALQLKNFNKKTNKQIQKERNNSDLNTQKKIAYQTKKQQSNIKTQKAKLPLANIYQSRNQINKENFKPIIEANKSKRQSDRSLSPLSYRVLMQKKKCQKEKENEQTRTSIQSYSQQFNQQTNKKKWEIVSKDKKSQNCLRQNFRSFDSSKDFEQKKQKLKSLKIILDQNSKTRTFCFEYLSGNKNLQRIVHEYCYQNSISGKNAKLIYQALNQQKPIITLKQP